MINKFKSLISKVISPQQDIVVNMDGGVGGSWIVNETDIECAIDEEVVDCDEMDNPPYIGIPAPSYLEDDPWFGPAPVRTKKQMDYMAQEAEIKMVEEQERSEKTCESQFRRLRQQPAQAAQPMYF